MSEVVDHTSPSDARWVEALAEFERSIITGAEFDVPRIDGPDGLGTLPPGLQARAERLLEATLERIDALQLEMDEVDAELNGLRVRRGAAGGSWTVDDQDTLPGAGHLV